MIMRAKQDGNVTILELEGHLDFETTVQFRDTYLQLVEKNSEARFIINLERLRFVGSSGINQFIRVLKEFNSLETKPRYCRLSSEFERLFRALQATRNPFEIFSDEGTAKLSFDVVTSPPKRSGKTKKAVSSN